MKRSKNHTACPHQFRTDLPKYDPNFRGVTLWKIAVWLSMFVFCGGVIWSLLQAMGWL